MNHSKLTERAESAERESKYIEFKSDFDVGSAAAWCELIKDIIALANSGGGIIVFGVTNGGEDSGHDVSALLHCDTADICNRISRYVDGQFSGLEIMQIKRRARNFPALAIARAEIPYIFMKPGTYDAGGGKQKVAFSQGTLYFRHGAKSEPANRFDLVAWRDSEITRMKKAWMGGIRKVVEAPSNHTIAVVPQGSSMMRNATEITARVTADPSAQKIMPMNAEEIWPYRQKDLLREINQALGGTGSVNPHDIRCIKKCFNILKQYPEFAYKPHTLSSPQYSHQFVEWIVKKISEDPTFLREARKEYKRLAMKRAIAS